MGMNIRVANRMGLHLGPRALSSIYASYALAEPFSTDTVDGYWVSGTKYATVNLLPGYSFTRTGQQGAVDAAGAVAYFAANVPAINSRGYHAYGALTNLLINSQAVNSWTSGPVALTVTADQVAAPDGTTTADKIDAGTSTSGHFVGQPHTTTAAVHTGSVFVKAGTGRYFQVCLDTVDTASFCNFDTQTGAVGTGHASLTGYIVNLGTGWYRLVVVGTAIVATQPLYCIVVNSASAVRAVSFAGTNETFYVWQAQVILGNFPDGGPIIVTAGATASIGASALAMNHTIPDEDYFVWGVVNWPAAANGSYEMMASFDAGATYMARNGAGSDIHVGGINLTGLGALSSGGRTVLGFRRKSGKFTGITRQAGVTTLGTETAGLIANPTMTAIKVGCWWNDTLQAQGQVELLHRRSGTFTDADIQAIVAAA